MVWSKGKEECGKGGEVVLGETGDSRGLRLPGRSGGGTGAAGGR